MIRKLDAMGNKGQTPPPPPPNSGKKRFFTYFPLSSSRKLIKLVSDVDFIQNATIYLWTE